MISLYSCVVKFKMGGTKTQSHTPSVAVAAHLLSANVWLHLFGADKPAAKRTQVPPINKRFHNQTHANNWGYVSLYVSLNRSYIKNIMICSSIIKLRATTGYSLQTPTIPHDHLVMSVLHLVAVLSGQTHAGFFPTCADWMQIMNTVPHCVFRNEIGGTFCFFSQHSKSPDVDD